MNKGSNRKKFYKERNEQILNLFISSPDKAFRLLFDTYYTPLCIYTVQLTDSFTIAEDIVQDFFIVFWEKKLYKNIAIDLRSYLFYSIRNNTYQFLKKNNIISMEELSESEIDLMDSLLDESELREKEEKMIKALEKLPKQELAAVKAVILENKKYKEAASELQISVNTLKTYLTRALKRLRKNNIMIYLYF